MFARPLSGTLSSPVVIPRPSPASGSTFGEVLNRVQAFQAEGGSSGVDARDEAEALKELFHLLAALSAGSLGETDVRPRQATAGETPGPQRRKVEALKAVLRRLSGWGEAETTAARDPVAAGPRTAEGRPGLRAPFESLPPDLQDLVREAFPDLDAALRLETGPPPASPPFLFEG